jgi:hypothetical protein
MDALQAKAFKLCLLWEKLVKKEFPGEHFSRLKDKGDPRKSTLFRYCYKLVRETNGLIPDKDYKLYIIAQLHVLKAQTDGKVHALIDPYVLVGDKAWRRWKVWKRHYEGQLSRVRTVNEINTIEKASVIAAELEKTYKFLEKEGVTNLPKVIEVFSDGTLIRWITTGKISVYWAIMSPLLNQVLGGKTLEEVCLFDFNVYRPSITESVKEFFNKRFSHEYIKDL